MRFVSAAEANRQFSKILREVREGETVVVTSHGEPVARIVPAERDLAEREAAKQALLKRLRSQPAQNLGVTWTRDELYDD
jgi:prevent-host-death family protein